MLNQKEIIEDIKTMFKNVQNKKTNLLALKLVKIETKADTCILQVTDLEKTAIIEIKELTGIIQNKTFLVNSEVFIATLIHKQDITQTINSLYSNENNNLINEYPFFSLNQKILLVSNVDFAKQLLFIEKFNSNDITKDVLTGYNFNISSDKIQLVSTDGYKLAVNELIKKQFNNELINFTIPKIKLNKKLNYNLYKDNNLIIFESINTNYNSSLITKCFSGNYPDYNRILPNNYSNKIVLDLSQIKQLISELKYILKSSKDKIAMIDLKPNNTVINFTVDTESFKYSFELNYSSSVISDNFDLERRVNTKFLLDILDSFVNLNKALKNIKELTIDIELGHVLQPIIFNSNIGINTQKVLIMPIRK